jgi:replicative DNA helicase
VIRIVNFGESRGEQTNMNDDILSWEEVFYNEGSEILDESKGQLKEEQEEEKNEKEVKDTEDTDVIPPESVYGRALHSFEKEMYERIIEADRASKKKLKPGYMIGDGGSDSSRYFMEMDKLLLGIQSKLYLLAGGPSHGKTALMLQMARLLADFNDDLFCIFISLDDAFSTVLSRVVASDVVIPSTAVTTPAVYSEDVLGMQYLKNREIGIERMLKRIDRFMIIGQEESNEDVDAVVEFAKQIKADLALAGSKRKPVLFIDKFHDLKAPRMRGTDEQTQLKYIGIQLKKLTTQHEIPVFATAEIRKLEGFKRPTKADVRETIKTEYNCDLIMLIYNEYEVRGDSAKIFYYDDEENKHGVIEVNVAKNKINGRTGYLFYHLNKECCSLVEADLTLAHKYKSVITQS